MLSHLGAVKQAKGSYRVMFVPAVAKYRQCPMLLQARKVVFLYNEVTVHA